jgi:cysteine-rich repeat protein
MAVGIVSRLTLLAGLLSMVACGGDDPVPDGPLAADAAGGDGAGAETCGDGVAAGSENCDGADLRGRTCADFGFNSGQLACHAACVFDLRTCGAVEVCDNGVDDDGDGDKDCDDLECRDTAACAVCGDGRISGGEQCEDGNTVPGDCCDATCRAEPGCEIEGNDTTGAAGELVLSGGQVQARGRIHPAGDADLFAVRIPAGSTARLDAEIVGGFLASDCNRDLDSELQLLDAMGRVVARDDDFGDGTCSRVAAAGFGAGLAYVRVAASPFVPQRTFDYRLVVRVVLDACGDGVRHPGQECDDGNQVDGDGCSSACRLEPVAEREPNDVIVAANGPFTPPLLLTGTIGPPQADNHDADWFVLDLPRPASLRVEAFDANAPGECINIDVRTILYDFNGADLWMVGFSIIPGADDPRCSVLATGGNPLQGFPPGAKPQVPPPPPPGDPPPPAARQLPAGRYHLKVSSRPSPGDYLVYVTYDSVCGDGVVQPPEQCEGVDGCDACRFVTTKVPVCGDLVVEPPEECDDGNRLPGDGCDERCQRELGEPACGNGRVDEDEQCDDGNRRDGDCCSRFCRIELGCEREPNDDPFEPTFPEAAPVFLRGTLTIQPDNLDYDHFLVYVDRATDLRIETFGPGGVAEGCPGDLDTAIWLVGRSPDGPFLLQMDDDGGQGRCSLIRRTVSPGAHIIGVGLGMAAGETPAAGQAIPYGVAVTFESICGDGQITGTETCDGGRECDETCGRTATCGDGIVTAPETCDDDGDECDARCGAVEPQPGCGDGVVGPGEECDDGNHQAGDGCDPTCAIEHGPRCGDGARDEGEACDDGNDRPGDGCDGRCRVEPGHHFEVEPNDDGTPNVAQSDFLAFTAEGPFTADVLIHAAIFPFGDDDVFAVHNPGVVRVRVVAETFGPDGEGTCQGIDTHLDLRDGAGALLASDEDGGLGRCARLELDLDPGETRYVQVTDFGDNSAIPAYLLRLTFD